MNEEIHPAAVNALVLVSKLVAGWEGAQLPCWALGRRSTIELDINSDSISHQLAHSADLAITLSYKAYIPTGLSSRTTRWVVNNVPVDEVLVLSREPRQTVLLVPLSIARAGQIKIDLLVDEAPTPRDVSESTDRRPLAVYMRSINCEVVPKHLSLKHTLIDSVKTVARATWPSNLREAAWSNADTLEKKISEFIYKKIPASVVRLGDGEGRILSNPHWLHNLDILHDVIWYQLGKDCLPSAEVYFALHQPGEAYTRVMETIRTMLQDAVRNCDALGIPTPVHFVDTVTPETVNGQLGFAGAYIEGRKIASHLAEESIFDTFIFRGLSRTGGLKRLLTGLPFVGIVYHSDVRELLAENFEINELQFTEVPAHQSFLVADSSSVHFPDAFFEIVKDLSVPFQGAVFLVGAGYLGKAYCDVIKRRGGIALDIGSVLDGWTGLGRTDVSSSARLLSRGIKLNT